MADRKFKLKGQAKGCKIKTQIKSVIKLQHTEIVLGENLEGKLELKFASDDIPNELTITAEVPDGFKPYEEVTINVIDKLQDQGVDIDQLRSEAKSQESDEVEWAEEDTESEGPVLEVPIRFVYEEADTGIYSVEFLLTHGEYGTELSDAENMFVTIKPPEIKIEDCKADNPEVVKGSEVVVRTKIDCQSPLKFRGIMSGQVMATDDSIQHRRYELPTKRIAIVGSKEISWNFKIPNDETGTGNFDVEIEFASRDTATSKKFENVLSLRKAKSLNLNKFTSSMQQVSEGDEVEIVAKFENSGLEPVDLEANLILILSSGKKIEFDEGKKMVIETGNTELLKWDWTVPENTKLGKIQGTLTWKIADVDEPHEATQELMEAKTPHDYKISSVITDKDYYGIGEQVKIKTFFSDNGTKAGERGEVELVILDIFGKEVYKERTVTRIDAAETVKEWPWKIPSKFDSGAYDIQFIIMKNDEVMVKKNFPKLLNIDLPVKLKLQFILPDIKKEHSQVIHYLREYEEVIDVDDHHKLSVYTLNSNTWIYSLNEIVPFGLDPNAGQATSTFSDHLFSYLVTSNKFSKKYIRSVLKSFNELGLCWAANVIEAAKVVGFNDLSKFKLEPNNWLKYCAHVEKAGKGNISTVLVKVFKTSKLPAKSFLCTFGALGLVEDIQGLKVDISKNASQMSVNSKKAMQSLTTQTDPRMSNKIIKGALAPWLRSIKSGKVTANKNEQYYYYSQLVHGIVILKLVKEIYKFLKEIEKSNYITLLSFSKYVQFQLFNYLSLIEFNRNRLRYDPFSTQKDLQSKINIHTKLIDSIGRDISYLFDKWKNRLNKYKQNMKKRNILANIRTNLRVTINPVEIEGMKGERSNNKILLGNSGELPIKFKAFIAMPSRSWSLIEPVTYSTREGVAMMKNIRVPPKQTLEVPVSIQFPKSLSFKDYTSIMKIEPIMGKIISEI